MKQTFFVLASALTFAAGCAGTSKVDHGKLEKYRHCYHQNEKIVNACIEKNEKGEGVTAMELENKAYPGQYK